MISKNALELITLASIVLSGCATTSTVQPQGDGGWEHRQDERPAADWIRSEFRPPRQRHPRTAAYADRIHFTIRKRYSKFQRCYKKALEQGSTLYGEVSITFEVAADGAIVNPRVDFSTLQGPTIEPCVLKTFSSTHLPPPPKPDMKVRYPMVFTSPSTPAEVMLALEKIYHFELESTEETTKAESKPNDYRAPW